MVILKTALSSTDFISGNGKPIIITARQSSPVKLIPSDTFPPTTANNMAPLVKTYLYTHRDHNIFGSMTLKVYSAAAFDGVHV